MKKIQDAYVVSATRSPVGKAFKGNLRNVRPDDLLAVMLASALKQVPLLNPSLIQDIIVGCAMPEGAQGLNISRISLLLAGIPNSVGGITVNRFCASGLSAIAIAADRIRLGEADVMIGGGVESMSFIPMMGNVQSLSPKIFAGDENLGIAYGMGLTAETVAKQWKVSRDQQDGFALNSHRKAIAAQIVGEFDQEITPIEYEMRTPNLQTGEVEIKSGVLLKDEGARPDISLEALTKLRPVFASGGSVTAGNSSQMSDGAGVVILASEKAIKAFDLTPLARFVSFAVRGVLPEVMGIGPVEAIPAALDLANLHQEQIDWIELNEAFAAQALAVMGNLKLDPAKVNPLGSAIALGHPLGATGAIRTATLLHGLRRKKLKYGMVSMCIGTGMGAAAIFERV
jgi:acetyl-CoA acyltransferase